MKMEVIVNGRTVPKALQQAVLLDASAGLRQRHEISRLHRRVVRLEDAPDRIGVNRAMLAVEERMVRAFWTIARLPSSASGTITRCGVDYTHSADDVHARYADAAGGKWETAAPRPSLPSSKDIDAANAALDWLLLIEDERLRRLFVIGATSKRGDAGRRINWIRLRGGLPEYATMTVRTMQRRYQDALRTIVTEMTLARMM